MLFVNKKLKCRNVDLHWANMLLLLDQLEQSLAKKIESVESIELENSNRHLKHESLNGREVIIDFFLKERRQRN